VPTKSADEDRWQVKTLEEYSVIFVCVYRFAESEKNSTVAISEGSRLADRIKKSLGKGPICNSSVPMSIVRFLHNLVTQKSSHIQSLSNERPMRPRQHSIRGSRNPRDRFRWLQYISCPLYRALNCLTKYRPDLQSILRCPDISTQ
jgi:hypothetical protein